MKTQVNSAESNAVNVFDGKMPCQVLVSILSTPGSSQDSTKAGSQLVPFEKGDKQKKQNYNLSVPFLMV